MLKVLTLSSCIGFIVWLLYREQKLHPMTSWSLWVAFLWIIIIGSRPVSTWIYGISEIEGIDANLEGSPLDRNIFFVLIVAGLIALARRPVKWGRLFALNRWFFIFFFYCAISILWSDYPFMSLKRWIKDCGTVVMVLIIFTERDPVQAFKAVFIRYASLVIPLSLMFIKYYPDIGRYYNRWTYEPAFCGVTTEKNALGCAIFICGMFLILDFIEILSSGLKKTAKVDFLSRIVLAVMLVWLILLANSSTALLCLILGVAIILFMRLAFARRQLKHLGAYSLIAIIFIIILFAFPVIPEAFVAAVGRDMTLTGRTDLWSKLLREPINPILGTGYQSFWQGSIAAQYYETFSFHPNQAHNGYLETYLNGGVLGVCLLMAIVISTGSRLKRALLHENNYTMFLFSFFILILIYNWTEATFNKLSLLWMIFLIAVLYTSQAKIFLPGRIMHGLGGKNARKRKL